MGRPDCNAGQWGAPSLSLDMRIFRVAPGVEGAELSGLGYSVGWLSARARAKKEKKPPRLPRETPVMEKRRLWAEKAKLYRARRKEKLGMEAMRAEWRAIHERRRDRALAAATLSTQAQGRDSDPGTGPAPNYREG